MTSDLQETVASLRPGDKVRATFEDGLWHKKFLIEGHVNSPRESGTLFLGGWAVRESTGSVTPAVTSVEILERAKQPFYTNSDREPRVGDVFWIDAFRWQVGLDRKVRCENGIGKWSLDHMIASPMFRGARLVSESRLVDPSELDELNKEEES